MRLGDIGGMREALERIRASPQPSGGRAVPFAKVAGAVFDEIESLRSERFKLTDICKALEAGGYLPQGSDPDSLGKALCRERKKRASRQTSRADRPGTKKRATGAANLQDGAKQKAAAPDVSPEHKVGAATGTQLKPGNLFVIEPLDLEGLPEL